MGIKVQMNKFRSNFVNSKKNILSFRLTFSGCTRSEWCKSLQCVITLCERRKFKFKFGNLSPFHVLQKKTSLFMGLVWITGTLNGKVRRGDQGPIDLQTSGVSVTWDQTRKGMIVARGRVTNGPRPNGRVTIGGERGGGGGWSIALNWKGIDHAPGATEGPSVNALVPPSQTCRVTQTLLGIATFRLLSPICLQE